VNGALRPLTPRFFEKRITRRHKVQGPVANALRATTMIEIFFIAQMVRNPLQAMARRWWCKSLARATRGQRRCPESTKS
jgi:hypothetical protein